MAQGTILDRLQFCDAAGVPLATRTGTDGNPVQCVDDAALRDVLVQLLLLLRDANDKDS